MVQDGDWVLLTSDAVTGRMTWGMYQEDGSLVIRTDYPVDAIIDENTIARDATEGKKFAEWNRVASIPLNIFHASGMAEATKQDDEAFIKRLLNDSDNRAWRTSRGKV